MLRTRQFRHLCLRGLLAALVCFSVSAGLSAPARAQGNTTSPDASVLDPLRNLSGASLEIAFMSEMIPHHALAVQMGQEALQRARHSELQTAAQKIVSSQQAQIQQMTAWLQQWYQTAPQQQWSQRMQQAMQDEGWVQDSQILASLQGDAFDQLFLRSMTPHHAMAAQMGQLVVQRVVHPELQAMVQNIIASQQMQIQEFSQWSQAWYGLAVADVSPTAADASVLDPLRNLSGASLEIAFMSEMIPHHALAVQMGQEALQRARHSELQTAAQKIVSSQQAQIQQMTAWLQQWYQTAPQQQWSQRMQQAMQGEGWVQDSQILASLQGDAFDQLFLRSMTPHHAMAVQMGQLVVQRVVHPELQAMVQNIIASQQMQIQEFSQWANTWYGLAIPTVGAGLQTTGSQPGGAAPGMPATGAAVPPETWWALLAAAAAALAGGLALRRRAAALR